MKIKEMQMSGGRTAWRIYCPGCKAFHMITAEGWSFNGDVDKPTFSPSLVVDANSSTVCHSFIREGKIEFLSDSYHELAGQTVDLPSFELELRSSYR